MKKTILVLGLFMLAFLMVTSVYARCNVNYTRTACKGQEAISYKKCGGDQSCSKLRNTDNVQECWQLAIKSCNNSRLNITKFKVITATYGGAQLIGGYDNLGNPDPNGTNFCGKQRPDLNQCM